MKPSEAHFKCFPSATRTTRQTAYSITQRQQGTLWKGVESDIKLGTVGEGKAKGANLIVHVAWARGSERMEARTARTGQTQRWG